MSTHKIQPDKIQLHKKSKRLELQFGTQSFTLSAEFLRVLSPSAEVRGHGGKQAVLQYGKQDVGIVAIELTGNYAIRITFDDGHNTGIYTWEYLHQLCQHQEQLWEQYLTDLHHAHKTRSPDAEVVTLIDPANSQ